MGGRSSKGRRGAMAETIRQHTLRKATTLASHGDSSLNASRCCSRTTSISVHADRLPLQPQFPHSPRALRPPNRGQPPSTIRGANRVRGHVSGSPLCVVLPPRPAAPQLKRSPRPLKWYSTRSSVSSSGVLWYKTIKIQEL
jgi:hypothetical protein